MEIFFLFFLETFSFLCKFVFFVQSCKFQNVVNMLSKLLFFVVFHVGVVAFLVD